MHAMTGHNALESRRTGMKCNRGHYFGTEMSNDLVKKLVRGVLVPVHVVHSPYAVLTLPFDDSFVDFGMT